MDLYNGLTMPLSNDPKLRVAQEKLLRGEELSFSEGFIAGRDHAVKEINGYLLKPDHVYRAITEEALNKYKEVGMIVGFDEEDEYLEYIENGRTFNNNKGVDWYLGGVSARYGDIIVECPADKEFFTPAFDNGSGMAIDPTVRHMKSSGYKNPVPLDMVTKIIYLFPEKEITEEVLQDTQDGGMHR